MHFCPFDMCYFCGIMHGMNHTYNGPHILYILKGCFILCAVLLVLNTNDQALLNHY